MRHAPQEALRKYADGELAITTRVLVEAHLTLCPTCPGDVAERRAKGARFPAATLHDELDLPPFQSVWERVEALNAQRLTSKAAALLPASLAAALPDPSAWRWKRLWPNRVKVALLAREADSGAELYLCRFAPGSTFPRHRHLGREDNVILSGEYRNGGLRASAGDWVVALPGSEEMPEANDDAGCWCLSRVEAPGVRFRGWRRAVARWM